MTLKEINEVITALDKKEKQEISKSYLLASQTAKFVNIVMNGKDIPPIEQLYPSVFQEQEDDEDMTDKDYQRMMFLKDQMAEYVELYNSQRNMRRQ